MVKFRTSLIIINLIIASFQVQFSLRKKSFHTHEVKYVKVVEPLMNFDKAQKKWCIDCVSSLLIFKQYQMIDVLKYLNSL